MRKPINRIVRFILIFSFDIFNLYVIIIIAKKWNIIGMHPTNVDEWERFKDSKGKWQDIDSSIEESTGETDDDGEIFGYKSHKNTFEAYLPKHSRGWVQLRSGKYRLAFKLLTNNKFFFNKHKNEIQVNNIFSHCDLKITLKNGLLKEDIILNSPSAPKTFTYLFRTKDLTMTQAKDGSFIFSNSAGKQIFMIPKFVMYDSNNAFSEDIKVVRKKLGNNYQITVTPNEKWLNDSKRVYPVVIDPTTISIEGTNPAIRSRFTYVFPSGDLLLSYNPDYPYSPGSGGVHVNHYNDVLFTKQGYGAWGLPYPIRIKYQGWAAPTSGNWYSFDTLLQVYETHHFSNY